MSRQVLLVLICAVLFPCQAGAQSSYSNYYAGTEQNYTRYPADKSVDWQGNPTFHTIQPAQFGLKTNLLYDATTTFNLGLEFLVGPKWTMDISANYNPWTFSDNRKFKHVLAQPELRYWFCDPFQRHFLGIHAHYAYYNVGNLNLPFGIFPGLDDNRYQGWLVGAGLSYGYSLYMGPRWNMEFTIGVGYAYMYYKRYDCDHCGDYLGKGHKNYFGPTKAGITLVYLIK